MRAWALAHGDDPRYRIVLAGYEPEHEAHMPASWRRVRWTARRAYGRANTEETGNRYLERLWFSPHCLIPRARPVQGALFGDDFREGD